MAFRQLGEFEYETFADLPDQGEDNVIYHVTSTRMRYRYVSGAYVAYYTDEFSVITPTISGAWHNVTMPINVANKTIEVVLFNSVGAAKLIGLRAVGSIVNRSFLIPVNGLVSIPVRVGSNNQVQVYTANAGQTVLTIVSTKL